MLEHRLAAAERTGDETGTALCDRVECINSAHVRLHDAVGARLLLVAADSHLHGPALHHGHLDIVALGVGQHGDGIVYLILTGSGHALDGIKPFERERNHDFVRQPALFDLAQPSCSLDLVAGLCDGGEIPELVVVKRCGVLAALEEYIFHGGQVVLQAVVAAHQQAGAQNRLQHMAVKLYLVTLAQAAGTLVNLGEGILAVHLDYLGHELDAVKIDVTDFVLCHMTIELDGHQVGDNTRYNTGCFHIVKSILFLL